MQIHELTRKQLNEVDLAGAGGLWSGIKSAAKAMVQPGGVKDALRTVAPGANQGLGSTAALTISDFAQRMQAVKNSAAIKQVAANLQKQWNQVSKTLPAATAPSLGTTTSASGYSSVKTNAPAGIPTVGGSKLPQPTVATQPKTATPAKPTTAPAAKSTEPMIVGKDKPLDPKNPVDAALIAKIQAAQQKAASTVTQESLQLNEAASLGQLTDWYKQSVIPKSMAAASAKYLANPVIKTALSKIIATADNPGEQSKAFADLVSATSVVSQEISAAAPAAAATSGGAPASTKTLSGGASAAKIEISRTAGISPTEIDAIAKLTSTLGRVQASDPNTIAYLQALGFKTA
jgi:hypothetical protein